MVKLYFAFSRHTKFVICDYTIKIAFGMDTEIVNAILKIKPRKIIRLYDLEITCKNN